MATVRDVLVEAYTADTTAEAMFTADCPGGETLIEVLTAHNILSTTEGIIVWVVPEGSAAADANQRCRINIPPYMTVNLCAHEYMGSILLEDNDFIWVQALNTDDKVAMAMHGWVKTP